METDIKLVKITWIPVDQIQPAEYNPREWTDQDFDDTKMSILEFGVVENLIVNDRLQGEWTDANRKLPYTMVGGHLRLSAMKDLGLTKVPCHIVSISPNKEKSLNVMLNNLGGKWDETKLSGLYREVMQAEPDLADMWGFNEKQRKNLEAGTLHDFGLDESQAKSETKDEPQAPETPQRMFDYDKLRTMANAYGIEVPVLLAWIDWIETNDTTRR